MHLLKVSLGVSLVLLCGACGLPQTSVSLGQEGGWESGRYPLGYPPGYSYGSGLVCDRYGRCWRRDDDHDDRRARPPDWAEDLPEAELGRRRFVKPDDALVCDRDTRVCYKRGLVDKSDTKEVFGRRAARHADRLRDERGSADIFIPERGVACDPDRQRCFADGEPDRKLSRRHFGRRGEREER